MPLIMHEVVWLNGNDWEFMNWELGTGNGTEKEKENLNI